MRTRRSALVGVGGLITLTGCSQQGGQPTEESDAEGATEEFGIDQFQVEGESPDEYEAEFISGSNPEEVADELTPEVSYLISGASGEVETEVRYEYSDATIPEDEPLDETVEADTHDGNGEYTQSPSMPDELVSEILQNPKNLAVRFRATDMESEVTETEEYELNFADSYIETAYESQFSTGNYAVSDANLEKVDADNGIITIYYESQNEIGSREFESEISNINGGYSEGVERTRVPYKLNVKVTDSNGDNFNSTIDKDSAKMYLNGDITRGQFESETLFNELLG